MVFLLSTKGNAGSNIFVYNGASIGDLIDGNDYIGTINRTQSGLACQAWSSQHPHPHAIHINISAFPDKVEKVSEIYNYCRSLKLLAVEKGKVEVPWCYTMNPAVRWQYCDVSSCGGKNTLIGSMILYYGRLDLVRRIVIELPVRRKLNTVLVLKQLHI